MAVDQIDRYSPVVADTPVTMEIEREEPWPARIKENAEHVDTFTVRYTGDNFWQVFHDCFYNRPGFPKPL